MESEGARYYDPTLGRFVSVDPFAGEYPDWSPYVYTLDNPLKFVDPDGRDVYYDMDPGHKGSGMTWQELWDTKGTIGLGAAGVALILTPIPGDEVAAFATLASRIALAADALEFGENLKNAVESGNTGDLVAVGADFVAKFGPVKLFAKLRKLKCMSHLTDKQLQAVVTLIESHAEGAELLIEEIMEANSRPDDNDEQETTDAKQHQK